VNPPPRRAGQPIAFAHRGARAERPENTIEAFARALELGATGLESDAWVTVYGQVVLDHDGATGPPWRRRPVATQSRADLPGHIPTLAELYGACGAAFELSLDIRDPAALLPVLAVAGAAGATSRLWLCHPDVGTLGDWRTAVSEARLVESTRVARLGEGLGAHTAALARAGVDSLNLHRRDWTAERIAIVHDTGLLAFGWDAQRDGHISGLLKLGIDGVYSDHVDRLMAALGAYPV